jgi:hypothetical protein
VITSGPLAMAAHSTKDGAASILGGNSHHRAVDTRTPRPSGRSSPRSSRRPRPTGCSRRSEACSRPASSSG